MKIVTSMKKAILYLALGLLFITSPLAGENCFLIKENNKIILRDGDCKSRHAPCSTFKIAISLMGYNEGLLIDETHPELPFKEGYVDWLDIWRQAHTPHLWIKNTCIWYSQVLTQKLGMSKFKEYVKKFNYGNQDISGDKGKNNGLTHSWLSSSLEISPEEQIVFLQKLIDNKLPVSFKTHEMTKNILFIEELYDGWKLYGKTGSGFLLNHDKTARLNTQIGWFIGWIQKNERSIIFAQYIQDEDKQNIFTGLKAKAAAKEKLINLLQEK